MAIRTYKELLVWQKSMRFVTSVYRTTAFFPREELYGLTGQLRRADVSVPSNIAEGQGRNSTKEFVRHLSFAYGSLMEVETQLEIAVNLGYLQSKDVNGLLENSAEIGRLLNGLIRSLKE